MVIKGCLQLWTLIQGRSKRSRLNFFGRGLRISYFLKKKKKNVTEGNRSNALSIDVNPIHWAAAANCQLFDF